MRSCVFVCLFVCWFVCARSPDNFYKPFAVAEWINVTEKVTLCCYDEWQYIPFNSTISSVVMGSSGNNAIVRVLLYHSFAKETHRCVEIGAMYCVSQQIRILHYVNIYTPHICVFFYSPQFWTYIYVYAYVYMGA
jgi:hypothetical protein